MALIKDKKILLDSDFTKDNFFTENSYLKIIDNNSLPVTSADVILKVGQPIFYSINNALNKLLENDMFIQKYGLMLQSQTESATKERVINAFKQDIQNLNSNKYETSLTTHLKDFHNIGKSSLEEEKYVQLSSIQNTCMKSDFSNFNEKQVKEDFLKPEGVDVQTSPNTSFSQDIVVEIEFNDSNSNNSSYLMTSICNDKTGHKFKYIINGTETGEMTGEIPSLLETPYIYRRWLSGLKEFFIYLPTTFTFYNEGYGQVNLLKESKDLNSKATWIQIRLNKRHFNLSHIYHMTICPQSLPMQIYSKDYQYFSDIMQPSMIRSLPISISSDNNMDMLYSENTNYYTLYFTCYGTDSQAIRILGD